MYDIQVYYQPFQLNASIFNENHLVLKPGSETQVMNITVDRLKELGFEFEDGCDYGEYSQAIYQLLNIRHDELNIHRNTFKAAGHTSMSVGDFIVYRPDVVTEDYVCHVCAPAGWKIIKDYNSFIEQYNIAIKGITELPVEIIEAMASEYSQDPIAFRRVFEIFTGKKCENHCPSCNSDDIDWGDHVHGDVIYQKAVCNECDCDFKEYYKYSDTEIDGE